MNGPVNKFNGPLFVAFCRFQLPHPLGDIKRCL
nr:MAG TPA: RNA polymerase-like protein [Caudoviricetes sp.]